MNIIELTLYSKNIDAQEGFYNGTMGFSTTRADQKTLNVEMGKSRLIFKESKTATPYHFALNIPHNQIHEALDWLKVRVDIQPFNENEIVDFSNWNAEAVYFYDPDMNIVELIARRDIDNASKDSFSTNSILEISEIGLPADDLVPVFETLTREAGISQYDGDLNRFCAMGDHFGLFICINRKIKDWIPNNDKALPSEFEGIFNTPKGLKKITYRDSKVSVNV